LKARISDYDKRHRALEDAERDLSEDRKTLEKEQTDFRAKVHQVEQKLAQRLKEAEAEIEAKRKQFEQHCRDDEQRQLANCMPGVSGDKADQAPPPAEQAAEAHKQRQQVEELRKQLKEQAAKLGQREQEVQQKTAQLEQARRDLDSRAASQKEKSAQ